MSGLAVATARAPASLAAFQSVSRELELPHVMNRPYEAASWISLRMSKPTTCATCL